MQLLQETGFANQETLIDLSYSGEENKGVIILMNLVLIELSYKGFLQFQVINHVPYFK